MLRTLELIDYFKPRFWGLENPQSGLLKTRPYMEGLPFQDVTYCSYGSPYTGSAPGSGARCPSSRGPSASRAPAARASATGATPPGRSALPAAALRDPPRAVRGDCAVGKRCASTNASKPS